MTAPSTIVGPNWLKALRSFGRLYVTWAFLGAGAVIVVTFFLRVIYAQVLSARLLLSLGVVTLCFVSAVCFFILSRLKVREPIVFPGEFEEVAPHRAVVARVLVRSESQAESFHALVTALSADLAKMREDLDVAADDREVLEQQLANAQRRFAIVQTKIDEQEKELQQFSIDSDMSVWETQVLLRTKLLLERQMAALRATAVDMETLVASLTEQIDANRSYQERIELSTQACERQVAELTELVNQARRRSMDDIAATR